MYNYKFILQTAFHLIEVVKVSDSQVAPNCCGKRHFWHSILPEDPGFFCGRIFSGSLKKPFCSTRISSCCRGCAGRG